MVLSLKVDVAAIATASVCAAIGRGRERPSRLCVSRSRNQACQADHCRMYPSIILQGSMFSKGQRSPAGLSAFSRPARPVAMLHGQGAAPAGTPITVTIC